MMTSRKRQYYSLGDGNVSKNTRRVFLLRYEDAEKEEIRNEGPFANKEKAIEKLNFFLKKGICSWLVTYNG